MEFLTQFETSLNILREDKVRGLTIYCCSASCRFQHPHQQQLFNSISNPFCLYLTILPSSLIKMFVYEGRLDWKPYGDNETFVIILPDGPVRVGDTAYLFSQWTKDAQGTKKANFFQKSAIEKVSKTPSGDDTVIAKASYYSWEVTSRDI
ncbi:uncharacterized protein BKA55DRAFT_694218 [Fusarium redolens]|uniref:Uncharacterized protein n=1 Tax=Fusarium redolens TaxID=48865 RepID=A0A9P9GGW4_FUSRE|nr:uncharacterized protein BKA55DRAFT_694218 [Fusarium redolens]KAH7237727.1 hypothetical protein BKA55DRAFT_694218 [Fusarium redolens]